MAEFRVGTCSHICATLILPVRQAAEDSLHRVYLTRTPPHLLQLPTSTFPLDGNILQDGSEGSYEAPELAMAEIMYASSGRSAALAKT